MKTFTFRKGQGYFDVTQHPYGGDFRRLTEGTEITPVKGPAKAMQIRGKLPSGRIACINLAGLIPDTEWDECKQAWKDAGGYTV